PPHRSTLFPYTTLFRSRAASTSTPSHPATSPPTTPRPCRTTRCAAGRSSTVSPPDAGATPTTWRAPPCSSPRTPPPTSTASSQRSEEHTSELQSLAYLV